MWKCSALMIFLSSSLLLVLQTLQVVNAATCFGSSFNSSSRYAHNGRRLFATLPDNVVTNGGFYNASVGQNSNRVYALALCARGYNPEHCRSCVQKWTQDTQTSCPGSMNSYIWASDDADRVLCLVRYSVKSSFGNLEMSSPVLNLGQNGLVTSINTTIFAKEWEAMANRTLEAAAKAENSSVKYFSVQNAEFTELPNVYMLMQCTSDLTSQDCKTCLETCKKVVPGRQGGMASYPSCILRWDLFPFHNAFGNVTRVPAPPRPQTKEKESSIIEKKVKTNEVAVSVLLPVLSSLLVAAVLVGFCCCVCSIRRNKSQKDEKQSREILGGAIVDDGENMCYLNLHDIMTATNAFSEKNKLGEGGFGPVFKGKLQNGMDVAIKRLSKKSSQGLTEFKNEVVLIIKLQHKNLVRLLGYCVESDEKLLIYEYMSNKSLDVLLFDTLNGRELDWETRMKIVNGTTRGLQYLHEYSRLRIIHRDLKASNILLDDEMNPKISDFGTARIFGCKQIDDSTQRIVGTFGYMSPEYALGGIISEKSDIYSFGVLLLEIISGKKATKFIHNDQNHSLIAYAWESWCETKGVSIIDETLCGSYSLKEVMRCVHIALLCVQDHPNDRPTISQIVYMLSYDNDLPILKQPTFSNVLNGNQQLVPSDYVFSINQVTQTELEAR